MPSRVMSHHTFPSPSSQSLSKLQSQPHGGEGREGTEGDPPVQKAPLAWLGFLSLSDESATESTFDSWVPLAACGSVGVRVGCSLGLYTFLDLSLPICKTGQHCHPALPMAEEKGVAFLCGAGGLGGGFFFPSNKLDMFIN